MKIQSNVIIALLGGYWLVSVFVIPFVMVRLDDFTVLATLYIARFIVHELAILFCLIGLIINTKLHSMTLASLLSVLMVGAGLFIIPSLIVLLPLALLNVVALMQPQD